MSEFDFEELAPYLWPSVMNYVEIEYSIWKLIGCSYAFSFTDHHEARQDCIFLIAILNKIREMK